MIKFVVALVSDFNRSDVNIDVSNERKSVDGMKTLKHIEKLTANELNEIRLKSAFQFVGDSEIYALMETPEWGDQSEIQ